MPAQQGLQVGQRAVRARKLNGHIGLGQVFSSELVQVLVVDAQYNCVPPVKGNFSIGVNLFFELNKKLARLMAPHDNYEVQLEEIHHTQKLDAPSGTAITLAEQVLEGIPRKKRWVNAVSDNPEDLVILSRREDPAPGTHSVKYHSSIDDIEIIHTAHNRKGFASGAVLAAEFIYGKSGIFSMKDVLGL